MKRKDECLHHIEAGSAVRDLRHLLRRKLRCTRSLPLEAGYQSALTHLQRVEDALNEAWAKYIPIWFAEARAKREKKGGAT